MGGAWEVQSRDGGGTRGGTMGGTMGGTVGVRVTGNRGTVLGEKSHRLGRYLIDLSDGHLARKMIKCRGRLMRRKNFPLVCGG